MRGDEADVVIVGGGPVGLAAAHCLGHWDVSTVLLEKRAAPSAHPRATMVNARTTEIFRLLGLSAAIEPECLDIESSARVSFLSSLAGPEIGRIELVESAEKLMRMAAQSPTLPTICPQNRLQAVLAQELDSRPSVRRSADADVVDVRPDNDGVQVDYRSDGEIHGIRAGYVILAEGLHGGMREKVGIRTVRLQPFGRLLDICFHADLRGLTANRQSVLYWIVNPEIRGVLITVAPQRGEWLLEIPALGGIGAELFADNTDHRKLIAAAVGTDVDPDIRSVRSWDMGTTMAAEYRDSSGRVFAAGDAAHTFPPTGGFGMNTGIQDAHNLCWRLAGVLNGWAGTEITAGYDAERRPVAAFNAARSERNALDMRDFLEDQAAAFAGVLSKPGPGADAARQELAPAIEKQRPHFDFSGQALGFRYSDADEPVVEDVVTYRPRVVPGARAPHFWLYQGDTKVSTVDLSRDGFVLFCSVEHTALWRAAVRVVPVPLSCCPVAAHDEPGYLDLDGDMSRCYGLSGPSAVLVRPDGHIAALLDGARPAEELAAAVTDLTSAPGGRPCLTTQQ